MATVLLIRHGRSSANTSGVLAGRTPGVHLDDVGERQVGDLGMRLARVPLDCVVTSPLERTRQTAAAIVAARDPAPAVHIDDRLVECGYGDWTGRELKVLAKEALWKTVQSHPSAVVFPGGEAMLAMQQRAVSSVRAWNAEVGDKGVYAVVSHGDVIKAVLADALGMHLDHFQRIVVDPSSVSIVTYGATRPFVHRVNDTSGAFDDFVKPRRKPSTDAPVGGGAGPVRSRRRG
jgi:probable phosphomutase (TIGR03848 family)